MRRYFNNLFKFIAKLYVETKADITVNMPIQEKIVFCIASRLA